VVYGPRRPPDTGNDTLLDQAHNTIERKLFAMKGFHHPEGSQQAFLTGLAQLYTGSRISVELSMPGNVGLRWKAGAYPHATGSQYPILTSGGFR